MDSIRYKFKITNSFFLGIMRDKFSCGHLVLQKDGTLKLLGRNESGGSRVCKITRFDMDFDEIHDRLREMFSTGRL